MSRKFHVIRYTANHSCDLYQVLYVLFPILHYVLPLFTVLLIPLTKCKIYLKCIWYRQYFFHKKPIGEFSGSSSSTTGNRQSLGEWSRSNGRSSASVVGGGWSSSRGTEGDFGVVGRGGVQPTWSDHTGQNVQHPAEVKQTRIIIKYILCTYTVHHGTFFSCMRVDCRNCCTSILTNVCLKPCYYGSPPPPPVTFFPNSLFNCLANFFTILLKKSISNLYLNYLGTKKALPVNRGFLY